MTPKLVCSAWSVIIIMLYVDKVCCHTVDQMYVTKLSVVRFKVVATVCVAALSQVRAKLVGSGAPTYSEYTCYTGIADFTPPDIDTVGYRVFLGNGRYFVSSDVGGGKMQWYGFHKEPAGMHLMLVLFTSVLLLYAVLSCWPPEGGCGVSAGLSAVHTSLLRYVVGGRGFRGYQDKMLYCTTWPISCTLVGCKARWQ